MKTPPGVNDIHESSLYVSDLDRTAAFYRDVFGFQEIARDISRHVFLRAGNDVLLLFDATVTRQATRGVPVGSCYPLDGVCGTTPRSSAS